MKHFLKLTTILSFVLILMGSCRDEKTVETEEVRVETEPAEPPVTEERVIIIEKEEEDPGLLEELGRETDKEVRKEVKDEINKIGDDN